MIAGEQKLGPDDLVLSTRTLAAATGLDDRIEAASGAGFAGIGVRPGGRTRALAAGATDAGLRARLRSRALRVVEIESLGNWGLGGEAGAQARRFEDAVYELADALGGSYLIAVGEIEGEPVEVAGRFAALCDRASAHGLAVALEFVPWTSIPDARTAWKIVRRADRPNAGVLVDAWHHYRGAADEDALLQIPPDRFAALHLSDADGTVVGTLKEDARRRRRLPGAGSFDLERFVRLLDGHGVRLPYAVEVLSDELHALSPAAAAAAAADAARSVLARARHA